VASNAAAKSTRSAESNIFSLWANTQWLQSLESNPQPGAAAVNLRPFKQMGKVPTIKQIKSDIDNIEEAETENQ
jgi:hypothetical protein